MYLECIKCIPRTNQPTNYPTNTPTLPTNKPTPNLLKNQKIFVLLLNKKSCKNKLYKNYVSGIRRKLVLLKKKNNFLII